MVITVEILIAKNQWKYLLFLNDLYHTFVIISKTYFVIFADRKHPVIRDDVSDILHLVQK